MANLTGVIALAAAALYGGWEWALVCLIVLVALWRFESGVLPVLATVGVSFFWLALFHWTGDRRLFFPYSMQFAVQMACLLRGRMAKPAIVGGGSIVLVFTVIRISQSATAAVLIVELAVAGAALALALQACGRGSREASVRVIAGALGSVLAFAGLAI
jgi:hypothetical protein